MIQSFDTKVQSALGLIPQPNSWTCQSTCIGMATGNQDIMGIRARLEVMGEPGDPAVMGILLKEHFGDRYHFDDNASLSEARDYLKQGAFLIVHGWETHAGHVIALNGVEIDPTNQNYRFKVLDPWSEFNFKAWAYDSDSCGFEGTYSSYGIYAACVAGQSFDDAAEIYRRGELDSDRKSAWIHVIQP
jgi:hypothetical protein